MAPIYLVSSSKNYCDLICSDSGPQYAEEVGLTVQTIDQIPPNSENFYILDPWLNEKELATIRSFIFKKWIRSFATRLVDPEAHPMHCSGLMKFAFEMATNTQASLIFPYEPIELTELLLRAYGDHRVLVSPYPYLPSCEIPLGSDRANKVIISGSNVSGYYPLRTLARRKRLTSLRWRLHSYDLLHPGWSRSAARKGGVIGEDYIQKLAYYRKMLICPSRLKLEFLKFRECAYASCCPIGEASRHLPEEAVKAFMPLTFHNFSKDIDAIISLSELECNDRAARYRNALRVARSQQQIQNDLLSFIKSRTFC